MAIWGCLMGYKAWLQPNSQGPFGRDFAPSRTTRLLEKSQGIPLAEPWQCGSLLTALLCCVLFLVRFPCGLLHCRWC